MDEIADQYDTSNPCIKIREEKGFPEKRCFTDSQLLIIQGTTNSSISIDKISVFGMRCPELLKIINQIVIYFRCFTYIVIH